MMKSGSALLVLLLALPVYGQETPADPAAEQPAADAPPSDTPPADTGEVLNSISTDSAAESAPADVPPETVATIPVEETPAAEPASPWHLYGGVDWVRDVVSVSSLKGFATGDYDSGMYRARLGARVFEAIAVETQFGIDNSDSGPDTAKTQQYYGLFLVPTAKVFDTVELSFPAGYARSKIEHPGGGASLSSLSYGLNVGLPIRLFSESLPDLRFEAGWNIYYQKGDARIYGLNAGLRYDFDVHGFSMGNPFSGMGGFFGRLWPFGSKDEAAPAQ